MCKAITIEEAEKITQANAEKRAAKEKQQEETLKALVGYINIQIKNSASEGNDVLQIINLSQFEEEFAESTDPEDVAIRSLFEDPELVLAVLATYQEAGFAVSLEVASIFRGPAAIIIKWGKAAEEDDFDEEDDD